MKLKSFRTMTALIVQVTIVAAIVERSSAQTPQAAPPEPPIIAQPAAPPAPVPFMSPGSLKRQQKIVESAVEDAVRAQAAAALAAEKTKLRMGHLFVGGQNGEMSGRISQASTEIRNAESDSARAAATVKLTELLDEYFERDMVRREQELADIEARLQKLRAQLDRRRSKKQEILDLQAQVVLNEADGLGFYSQPDHGEFFEVHVEAPVVVPPSGDTLMLSSPPPSKTAE